MTPVMLLTDGYLANGSEPWQVPKVKDLPDIDVKFADKNIKVDDQYMPYLREKSTLARLGLYRHPWIRTSYWRS